MAFDPCREWLGIDAVDLANARLVLGLPPGDLDAEAIARAAATRLEAVRRIAPGPFAKAHAAILARIGEARDELLATVVPVAPPVPPAPEPAPQPVPAPLEADEPRPPAAADSDVVIRMAAPRRPVTRAPHRAANGGGLVLGTISLLGAAVAVLAFLVTRPEWTPGTWLARLSGPGRPAAAPGQGGGPPLAGEPAAGPGSADSAAAQGNGRERQRQSGGGRQRGEDGSRPPGAVEEIPGIAPVGNDPEPAPPPSLDGPLREAYAALQRQQFDTADRALAAAAAGVGDDVEAATRLERWRLLGTYARGFAGYRDQAYAAANAGREYEANGRRFSIIEINASRFVYRLGGRTARVARDAVDPAIEMAVVGSWFAQDGRAANHLFLGARWLCLAPPDPRRARAEWQAAGSGGEAVAPLLALLDDPVIRGRDR